MVWRCAGVSATQLEQHGALARRDKISKITGDKMINIDKKAQRALELYLMGEIAETAIKYLPKRRFIKRRYFIQLSLDLVEWTLIEFGTTDEYHRQLRKTFPKFPEIPIFMDGILNDVGSKITIFGWTKQYKKQKAKIKEILGGDKL